MVIPSRGVGIHRVVGGAPSVLGGPGVGSVCACGSGVVSVRACGSAVTCTEFFPRGQCARAQAGALREDGVLRGNLYLLLSVGPT